MRRWDIGGRAGDVDMPVGRWKEFQTVPGVLIASIPIDHRVSLYARFGDWLPWGCWLILGVGVILGFVRGRGKTAGAAN